MNEFKDCRVSWDCENDAMKVDNLEIAQPSAPAAVVFSIGNESVECTSIADVKAFIERMENVAMLEARIKELEEGNLKLEKNNEICLDMLALFLPREEIRRMAEIMGIEV